MSDRDVALTEIQRRIDAAHETIGLSTFKQTPTTGGKVSEMPICYMTAGTDAIVKRTKRSVTSKGCTRKLEVIIEIVGSVQSNVLNMCRSVRDAIMVDCNPVKDENGNSVLTSYIYEERMEGPVGYGIENIEAIVLVINLVYTDN